jgi:hypothetical protein
MGVTTSDTGSAGVSSSGGRVSIGVGVRISHFSGEEGAGVREELEVMQEVRAKDASIMSMNTFISSNEKIKDRIETDEIGPE